MTTSDKTIATLLIIGAIGVFGYEYWNALEPIRNIVAVLSSTK